MPILFQWSNLLKIPARLGGASISLYVPPCSAALPAAGHSTGLKHQLSYPNTEQLGVEKGN